MINEATEKRPIPRQNQDQQIETSSTVTEWYGCYDKVSSAFTDKPEELIDILNRKAIISTIASMAVANAGLAPLEAFANFCQQIDDVQSKAHTEATLNEPPKLSLRGFMTGLKGLETARRELLGEPIEEPKKKYDKSTL